MKKKLISVLLIVILVFSLSVPALAVGTTPGPNLNSGEPATGDPAEISTLLTTVMTNRATLLSIKSSNITLAVQLKTMMSDLKSGGKTIPEETLNKLKASKDQLKATHQQLRDTVGQLDPLMDSFKEYRKARDFDNAAKTLEQVVAIQKTRIDLENQIGVITQQMLDLVKAV